MSETLKLREVKAERRIKFQAYGVVIGIEAERLAHLEAAFRQLGKIFPGGLKKTNETIDYLFTIKRVNRDSFELYRNEEKVIELAHQNFFYDSMDSQVRVTIAEFAREKVFLHAGVVGWKGRAIIIPAQSWSGKTTLVAELVKKGAAYYSDEYAVLDAEGNVEPFPKWLSMRSRVEPFAQIDQPVEDFGGFAGTETIPVGIILISKFDKNKKTPRRWQPKRLTQGQAMMEILPHTMPIRNEPQFVLKVLNNLTNRAIIVKTVRGEAEDFADTLLNYLDHQTR